MRKSAPTIDHDVLTILAATTDMHYLAAIRALANAHALLVLPMRKRRGGVPGWIAEQQAERNAAYRERARAEYGTEHLTPTQAEALADKVKREVEAAQVAEGSGDLPSDAIRRIKAAGIIKSGRHLRRVLPETE
jgi:hypothetical protein